MIDHVSGAAPAVSSGGWARMHSLEIVLGSRAASVSAVPASSSPVRVEVCAMVVAVPGSGKGIERREEAEQERSRS